VSDRQQRELLPSGVWSWTNLGQGLYTTDPGKVWKVVEFKVENFAGLEKSGK